MQQGGHQANRPFTEEEIRLYRIAQARQSYYDGHIRDLTEIAHRWRFPRPNHIHEAVMVLHRATHCLYMLTNPLGLTPSRLARALNEADNCVIRAKSLLGV